MQLENHKVYGDTSPRLEINVLDEKGPGGAHHMYQITNLDITKNASYVACNGAEPSNYDGPEDSQWIMFQNGPIKEVGVNGVTHEALLAIVIHRLECFQAGPFASAYNEQALQHCKLALLALKLRTRDRINRGVEGTTVA